MVQIHNACIGVINLPVVIICLKAAVLAVRVGDSVVITVAVEFIKIVGDLIGTIRIVLFDVSFYFGLIEGRRKRIAVKAKII